MFSPNAGQYSGSQFQSSGGLDYEKLDSARRENPLVKQFSGT